MSEEFKDFQHLVRISGTDIRGDKNAVSGLTYIRGIGFRMSTLVLKKAGIPKKKYIGLLTQDEIKKINDIISEPSKYGIPGWFVNHAKERRTGKDLHLTGSDLALYDRNDIDRLKKLRTYRGIRHAAGLKVRGQRTKSTGRGGRSLGVSRKKLLKEMEKKGEV
ncbi:MAG: 30S ribosomal protein S13 [Asgard group archaeon]|nr:30S ribosomal protein S13 [Asgard group archaeon]